MTDITISLPPLEQRATVEIEVVVSGTVRRESYRVVLVSCEDEPRGVSADCLKRALRKVEPDWQLMTIGTPGHDGIPLLFRRRDIVLN
jgi:hypothetical protein